jgi:flagellar basal body rod protein FlgC
MAPVAGAVKKGTPYQRRQAAFRKAREKRDWPPPVVLEDSEVEDIEEDEEQTDPDTLPGVGPQ